MKRFEMSILFALIFCALLSFCSFERECSDIRSQVFRLHILANSDSEADQSLKLRVRDRILESTEAFFSHCQTLSEAKAAALANMDIIEQAAQDEIADSGMDYTVNVELAESYFSTRSYDCVTLPAGVYDALRVEIGEAQGHNWWCVMFPMMCLPGSSGSEELGTVLSDGQLEIVEADGYEIRFRCVEMYEEMCAKLRKAE